MVVVFAVPLVGPVVLRAILAVIKGWLTMVMMIMVVVVMMLLPTMVVLLVLFLMLLALLLVLLVFLFVLLMLFFMAVVLLVLPTAMLLTVVAPFFLFLFTLAPKVVAGNERRGDKLAKSLTDAALGAAIHSTLLLHNLVEGILVREPTGKFVRKSLICISVISLQVFIGGAYIVCRAKAVDGNDKYLVNFAISVVSPLRERLEHLDDGLRVLFAIYQFRS